MRPVTTTTRTRLTPDERRTQLLDLGVRLLATRSLDELTIDLLAEEAGISRGLLYHYFGNKHAFHEAVVRRAVDDLIAQTAPPAGGEPLDRLLASVAAYVDYVVANYEGYVSIVKGAAGGNETLRQIYEEARAALTDRIFTEDAQGELIPDTPAQPADGPGLVGDGRGAGADLGRTARPASPGGAATTCWDVAAGPGRHRIGSRAARHVSPVTRSPGSDVSGYGRSRRRPRAGRGPSRGPPRR